MNYSNWIYLDCETTGLCLHSSRIVQLSLIYKDKEYNLLLNPTIPIPSQSSNVHKIYDKDVRNSQTFADIADRLFKIFNECEGYITYNGDSFDLNILAFEFMRCNLILPNKLSVDVYKMVQMNESSKKLKDVYNRYIGEELKGAHNSIFDTRATKQIHEFLLKKLSI